MKICVLNGSPRLNGNTSALVKSFKEGAESAGHIVDVLNVGSMNIRGCNNCQYCRNEGDGKCKTEDDMQIVYPILSSADMIVLASPIYYWSFSGQMQSTITRFFALTRPKANKYAMILSSGSKNVYNAVVSQYNDILSYFGATSLGVITACGDENKTPEKLEEVFNFAKDLK